ncbi:MAG: methylaspartate mutase [Candidatus Cloacimonadota bacterium]|nr:MAG: methylaspartate mutase [Candidatus Cloacimonadota bacterium]
MGNSEINAILATDCGSTTTKAILIEKKNNEYRLIVRGEAPTTVEAPFEDVTKGVLNAIREVEELADREILDGEDIITPRVGEKKGVDIYISTSSAGGGLQMMVAGVVKTMTAESAARAALGAGAIVMETIASNDGRLTHEKIELIRRLRPDMILLSGGIDGGTVKHVVELAEIIGAADPRPRFGTGYSLPVIYAGNKDARDAVRENLEQKTDLSIVDNLRPILEMENLEPARHEIHDLFMEHVMAHAPGYKKLMGWTDVPIMPTPGAVGLLIKTIGEKEKIQVIGVDIGGATTDIFSVFRGIFNRTVSANLGMSYSISNVLAETGVENIMRWVHFEVNRKDLRNRIKNKMIRPTTIPQTLMGLQLEQAIAREAIRLAFLQHKSMAVGLKGIQQERTISDAFNQAATGESLVDMMNLDLIVGSGGALSHAPRRNQAALMLIDGFLPEGVTRLAVDSIFMMPQLGVLSTINDKAATEVFDKDCLIKLGTCIAPVGKTKEGRQCVKVSIGDKNIELNYGEMALIPLGVDERKEVVITPAKNFDVGAGKGKQLTALVEGGIVGLIIDARGRPLEFPEDDRKRMELLTNWNKALEIYPEKT